jgi:protocatechuate 3,4-dioxygenase beta subunit
MIMNRKKFLKDLSIGAIIMPITPTLLTSCTKDDNLAGNTGGCVSSPVETAGPFPIRTPSDWIRANIVGNRTGVALMMNFTIQNVNSSCAPLQGVEVDVWMCDAKGNYSEYNAQLDGDFTAEHFLRGRQTTNAEGKVSFVSIYPGWYPGRAPHIHIEIKRGATSLLVTQVAFPEDISRIVYATTGYKGVFDTSNTSDGVFINSLNENMADAVTGDVTNGYTLTKIIKVPG